MRGVFYRTEKDGTPLATPELRISATKNRTVYYDNAAARDAAMQAGEIKEGSIVLTGVDDEEGGDYVTRNQITPDWENAVAITASQLIAGYTCPSNGMIVGVAWKDDTRNVNMFLKLNGVTIAASKYTNSDWAFANVQISVNGGDVLRETGATALTSNISFVPYKA